MSRVNEERIKKMLTNAYDELAVDLFERIQNAEVSRIDSMSRIVEVNRKSRNVRGALWGTAIAAVIAMAILFGIDRQPVSDYAYIYIDVNPSVELVVNKNGSVVSCRAYNKDGRDIVDANKVIKSISNDDDLAVVIESVITSIRDRGYFSGQYDSVLVSGANTEILSEGYLNNVMSEVSMYVQQKKMCNNVVYRTVADFTHAKEIGDKYGISPGKADYVEEVATSVAYTEEELAAKNIDAIFDIETESIQEKNDIFDDSMAGKEITDIIIEKITELITEEENTYVAEEENTCLSEETIGGVLD